MGKWLFLLVIVVLLPSLRPRAAAASGTLSPKFPARHPYLMITAEEIARVQSRAEAEPWAREALDRILGQ